VLLLDEPFNALDAFTRIDLQEHLLEVWRWYRPILAHRVVVLGGLPGRIHAEIDAGLPRPRDRTQAAFHAYQDRAMAELRESEPGPQAMAQTPGSPSRVPSS
jgi:sulfonate transport system ATP-binding protein